MQIRKYRIREKHLMKTTRYRTIPRVKIATIDGGQPELEINDDPLDGYRLNVTQSPILVTMCRIGKFIGIKGSDA